MGEVSDWGGGGEVGSEGWTFLISGTFWDKTNKPLVRIKTFPEMMSHRPSCTDSFAVGVPLVAASLLVPLWFCLMLQFDF